MDYGSSAAVNIGGNAAMPESKGTSSTGWSSIFFRVLQLVFSMIAFALVASADRFEHAALGYLVAAGVINFVYALFQLIFEFVGSPSVQLDVGLEFFMNILLLSSAAAAAAAREETDDMSSGEEGRVIAGVVFQFFAWLVSSIMFWIMIGPSVASFGGEVAESGRKPSALTYRLS